MTTPVFPASLPGVTRFSWESGRQILASDSPGPRAVNRISRVPSATASVEWEFVASEYQTFMDFWRVDLIRGHRWFLLTLPSAAGFKNHIVRFKEHRKTSFGGHQFFRVQATLEVRVRKVEPELLDLYFTSKPYPVLVSDGLSPGLVPVGMTLTTPILAGIDKIQPALTPVALTLESLLKSFEETDSVESELTALGLTLAVWVRKSYTVPEEGVESSLTVQGLTLEFARIEFTAEVDGLASGLTVQGLTLT